MAGYRLTPQAKRGLGDVLRYIEDRFGVLAADRALTRLVAAFDLLVENPGLGHSRADLEPTGLVRFWPVGASLIAYRSGTRSIESLFVERGERDWGRVFAPDS